MRKPYLYIYNIIVCLLLLSMTSSLAAKDKPLGLKTVVIDAGHGGEDEGCNYGDINEKDLNLEIAFLLNDILELNGNSVKMTRRTDTLLYDYYGDLDNYKGQKKVYDLKNRLKITNCNHYNVNLFISYVINTSVIIVFRYH